MRAALGLEAPERRIGLSAHDFAQGCGAPELILSHPRKLGGAPTVPSRFLQRLEAVSGEARWKMAKHRGDRFRRLAALIEEAPAAARIARPEPAPPVELRPKRLSVTEIETWLRDPYTIYARHVLRLRPLDMLDEAPGAAERGSAIHDALGAFAQAFPEALPAEPEAALLAFGREAFRELEAFPAEYALWWARFERLVPRYVGWERARRADARRVFAELGGRMALAGGRFALTGRADRIEQLREGGLAIIDFKTGAVPTAKQTAAHYSPQLPLEAAMAAAGGFRDLPAEGAAALTYVRLGTAELKEVSAVDRDETAFGLAASTLERLEAIDSRLRKSFARLCLAGAADVPGPLRRLRPSGAGEGMVDRRGGRGMSELTDLAPGPLRAATALQTTASDPLLSAWVSANAGSGKTHVLARRVIRLLMRGVPPGRILCLTYTKAAAANMANRVLDELRRWATLDDEALDKEIVRTDGGRPDALRRAHARRLFAQALETPGGLKIQTIHAFCGALLHAFPFEAGVPAGFGELEEAARLELLARVRADVVLEAAGRPDSALGQALGLIVGTTSDDGIDEIIGAMVADSGGAGSERRRPRRRGRARRTHRLARHRAPHHHRGADRAGRVARPRPGADRGGRQLRPARPLALGGCRRAGRRRRRRLCPRLPEGGRRALWRQPVRRRADPREIPAAARRARPSRAAGATALGGPRLRAQPRGAHPRPRGGAAL